MSSSRHWAILAAVHLVLLVALVTWIFVESRPVAIHPLHLANGEKFACLSYSPISVTEQHATAAEPRIERTQIERDLKTISRFSRCVRTYSVANGLDQVPAVARALGMKVLLGASLGSDEKQNAEQLQRALKTASVYSDVVRALVVGNETILRNELKVEQLQSLLKTAKAQSHIHVTYADAYSVWAEYPELAENVDFVTANLVPYREDNAPGIDKAVEHIAGEVRSLQKLSGKNILIGEAGWPSAGRQRDQARPTRVNQAHFIRSFVARARAEKWDYNLFEALDQPWRRASRGTVSGYWGLANRATGQFKFPFTGPIAERASIALPLAAAFVGAFIALVLALVSRGAITAWRSFRKPLHTRYEDVPPQRMNMPGIFADPRMSVKSVTQLIALTLVGATTGIIAALNAEHASVAYVSFIHWVLLSAVALAAIGNGILMAYWQGDALPPADKAWHYIKQHKLMARVADALTALRTFMLLACAIATLLLAFDGRYRDFPTLLYLTPAACFGVTGWIAGRFSRPEQIVACIIVACGVIGWMPEPTNTQSLAWLVTTLALALPILGEHFLNARPSIADKQQEDTTDIEA